jgi:hypothetical protein
VNKKTKAITQVDEKGFNPLKIAAVERNIKVIIIPEDTES